ncbi:hypothetical protein BvCmsNSP039_01618 [Escherichia coli]|nr:hypothetical protein BvCmsKKP062_05011 [Escherichia coli]GDQ26851.1 hypothetical protein BvCmsNSP039_01618 [Escherichia coli]
MAWSAAAHEDGDLPVDREKQPRSDAAGGNAEPGLFAGRGGAGWRRRPLYTDERAAGAWLAAEAVQSPAGMGGQGYSVPYGIPCRTAGDTGGNDAGDDRFCRKPLVHPTGI